MGCHVSGEIPSILEYKLVFFNIMYIYVSSLSSLSSSSSSSSLIDAKASVTVWIYFSPFIIGNGTVLQFDLFFEKFCSKEEVKKNQYFGQTAVCFKSHK